MIALLNDEVCAQIAAECLNGLWLKTRHHLNMLKLLYHAGKCGARVNDVKALNGKAFGRINNVACGVHNNQPGWIFEL